MAINATALANAIKAALDAALGAAPTAQAAARASLAASIATPVASAHNADAGAPGAIPESVSAPPAASATYLGTFYLYRPGTGQPSQLLLCEQTSTDGVYEWSIVSQSS